MLHNVNLKIPEYSVTAIVGPSGSGKSTICNLIARFYDADSGSIRVGGHDVKEFTCDSLLSNISMVFQNVYLFHDTVRNNICFGKPDATEVEMVEAAKKACCHDFIMALPEGYDTVIGEGGGSLSGGEKQRISIARAILKDAPIIILDEATASVDPENEHLIQAAISELTKGKTIVTIAHRLATIEQADQILVVDNGQIVQRGTHRDLVAIPGKYKDFVDIRSQSEGWKIGEGGTKNMEESRKLSGKDLITIGIFSAIYFVLNLAAMITGFVPVLWLLLPGVTGIVTGIPFLLMASKVRKPGAVLIMGTITALLYFVTGQFTVLLLITFAIACILSELYRAVTKYDNSFTHMMISFVFFCYGMLGSPLAIWVYKDSFLAQIQQNGMSADISGLYRD